MKCKISRRKYKDRVKAQNEIFFELKELNPKRNFSMEGNVIYVDTDDLWKVKLPESAVIIQGENKEQIEYFGFISFGIDNMPRLYLRSW